MLDFIFFAFWALMTAYFFQLIFAWTSATEQDASGSSISSELFGNGNRADTWTTILVVFAIPVGISWLASIGEVFADSTPQDIWIAGCLSMLLVLVTLEFSVLRFQQRMRKPWTGLLVVALALDLIAIVLLVAFIKTFLAEAENAAWQQVSTYVQMICLASFLSSFFVILFSMGAEQND